MTKKWIIAASTGLAAAMLIAGAAAAVGTNGGFEDGTDPDPGGGWRTLPASSTVITDWTVVSGSIDWIGTYWQASEGTHSIDLNGNSPGAISQSLTTVIGATYSVTFDLSGNPDNAVNPTRTLTVSATGGLTTAYSYDMVANAPTRTLMKWDDQLYTFVAIGNTTTLTFTSTTPNVFYGPALDNVVVTETLPTAAKCKKDGWKTMTDYAGNTFKNQGDCVSFFATGGSNPGAGS